jgi:hypothetical protein
MDALHDAPMHRGAWFVILGALAFDACHTTKEVAVGTFRVIDAPANYIRHKIDQSDNTTTTTTTTTTSDVSNPGYPITNSPPPPRPPQPQQTRPPQHAATSSTTQHTQTAPKKVSSTPTPTPRPAASQPPQFPVARPVPGRPGYVYSLDPNGGMIDVTGYKSGDRAKDPYTKQVFIVP